MGVDLSSYSIAMVVLEDSKPYESYKVTVETKYRKDRALVAHLLYTAALRLVTMSHPDAIFIEEPVVAGARNLRSSLLIAQVCGVMLVAAGMGRVVKLTPVSSWKVETVGHGNADKDAIRRWLDHVHPAIAKECGLDQDLYDASCVALYGQGLLGRGDAVRSGLQDGP